jgi:hypothetical protein
MDPLSSSERLEANALVFGSLLVGVEAEQASWKPTPEQWSMLEVVNHLADEEVEDFRRRLDLTLNRPGEPWPAIDPPGWAVERRYNERSLDESFARFVDERQHSVAWLRTLAAPEWERAYAHPRGSIRAGDLLASWLDHDLIHIRQLTRLHHQWLVHQAEPYLTDYAGGF